MTAKLRLVGKTFVPEFGPTGALRQDFGTSGRIHLDRPLPFIVLHRIDPNDRDSLAHRVAATSPAYGVWGPDDDAAAMPALEAVIEAQRRQFGRILLVSLHDQERPAPAPEDTPSLHAFIARIGASADPAADAAAAALEAALVKVEIDLRLCEVERVPHPRVEPGLEAVAAAHDCSLLSLALPRNYLAPDGRTRYPQLFHELAVGVFDALLKSACAFMEAAGLGTPRHYRGLGRSAFIDAARRVDARLDRLCGSFDFLLSVSPINTTHAFEAFAESGCEKPPEFRYRPLTVDPDEARRGLYRIDVKAVEDPVLERLFSEKRQEVDHQLNMLEARNTPRFRFASLMLYAPVDSALREAAGDILAAKTASAPPSGGHADCHAVAAAARRMARRYAARDPAFRVNIELRDDVAAGMMVTGRSLLVSTDTHMPARRIEPLLHHEVGVHLLTYVNGSKQGLTIFKRGLAGYEGLQEGLGVFAEWAVGGLTRVRLRLLAARVVAVDAMVDGAGFVDVFRLLRAEHGFSAKAAFTVTARVFRSGGLAKDAIYLRGFKQVLDLIAAGHDLAPFWYGKIAADHVPIVEELAERGILARPTLAPEFLADPEAQARIDRFRANPNYATLG